MEIEKPSVNHVVPVQQPIKTSQSSDDLFDLDIEINTEKKIPNEELTLTNGTACSGTCASCNRTCGNCQSIGRVCK